MLRLGLKTSLLLTSITWMACAPVKPAATDYKEKLSAPKPSTAQPTPTTGGQPQPTTGTTPGGTPAATGNATNGLAILTANCETAMCHPGNGIPLAKTSTINDTTGEKAAHRGVQPVFTVSNINDMKAALAAR